MFTDNNKHRGKIFQKIIKDQGLKVKEVARRGNISRGTLYNYFGQKDLDNKILLKFGKVLRYDFSIHFHDLIPLKEEGEEIDGLEAFGKRTTKELSDIQRKYYRLLEKHNLLLKFLLQVSHDYELTGLKSEVEKFSKIHFREEK